MKTTLFALGILFTATLASLTAGSPPNPQPPGNLLDSRLVEKTSNDMKATLRVQISSYPTKFKDGSGKEITGVRVEATALEAKLFKKNTAPLSSTSGQFVEQPNVQKTVNWNITFDQAVPPTKNTPPALPLASPQAGGKPVATNQKLTLFTATGTGNPKNLHGQVTLSAQGYPSVVVGF